MDSSSFHSLSIQEICLNPWIWHCLCEQINRLFLLSFLLGTYMTVTNLYFKNFNISDHIKAKGTDYWDDFKYLFILPTTHYHHICLTLWNTQAIQPDCLPDWTSLHATCQRSKESLLWPDVSFWTSEFRFSGSVKTVAHCCLSWKPHHGLRNWLFISNCLDLAWANLLSFVPADAITRHCLLPGCQTAGKQPWREIFKAL